MNKLAKVGLTADEAVWNLLLTAKSWQVDDGLNGINVVCNNNELSLGLFNKSSNMVETEFDVDGFGGLKSTFHFTC